MVFCFTNTYKKLFCAIFLVEMSINQISSLSDV